MPNTVVNTAAMNCLDVTYPSGKTRTVNLLIMLVQTQNAEFYVKHGMFLPGLAKQHPTVKALREKYELDYFFDKPVRTWKDCAIVMRHVYTEFNDYYHKAHAQARSTLVGKQARSLTT